MPFVTASVLLVLLLGWVGKMAQVEVIFETPSVGFWDGRMKEHFLKIADDYRVEISDKRRCSLLLFTF